MRLFISASFLFIFRGFLNTFQIEVEHVYYAEVHVEHFGVGHECIENACSKFTHPYTQLATSDFQTELTSQFEQNRNFC